MMRTIGITGVGGGVGQSVIKALQKSDYNLIGMDGEILGTGLYAVGKAYKIPYSKNQDFIDVLLTICKENKIELLFPGLDAELYKLEQNKERFSAIGTIIMVSDKSVIDIAENKWDTFEKLTNWGFNVPFTIKLVDVKKQPGLPFPFIIKPYLGGARSKDVYLVNNQQELTVVLEKIKGREMEFILQEYLTGEEYTCGTVTLDGECRGTIIMKRELRAGDTYKCEVIESEVINDFLISLMNKLQPFGACNVQLKLKDGKPYIFEINARCSGTTGARALCGFNEPKMVADYLLKGIEPRFSVQHKTILRYWNELEAPANMVSELKQNGFAENNTFIPL